MNIHRKKNMTKRRILENSWQYCSNAKNVINFYIDKDFIARRYMSLGKELSRNLLYLNPVLNEIYYHLIYFSFRRHFVIYFSLRAYWKVVANFTTQWLARV